MHKSTINIARVKTSERPREKSTPATITWGPGGESDHAKQVHQLVIRACAIRSA